MNFIKKLLLLVVVIAAGVIAQYVVVEGLVKNNQGKSKEQLTEKIVYLDTIINLNSRNISSIEDFNLLNGDENISSIKFSNVGYIIDPSKLEVNDKYFFIKLSNSDDGKIEKHEDLFLFFPSKPMNSVALELNTITKEKDFKLTVIDFKLEQDQVKNFEIKKDNVYSGFVEEEVITKKYSVKLFGKILKNIEIKYTTYSIEEKFFANLYSILTAFNIIFFALIVWIIYLLNRKTVASKSKLENKLGNLSDENKTLKRLKDVNLNESIREGKFSIESYKVSFKDKSGSTNEKIFIDVILKDKKLSQIDLNLIEEDNLSYLNKELLEFAANNNLIGNDDVVCPLYYNNLYNNEFVNWFEFFVLNHKLDNGNFYISNIGDSNTDFFNKMIVRFKDRNFKFAVSHTNKSLIKEFEDKISMIRTK